ncbi:hypothetical protein An02g13760 [Aspergillus niger]|uniref:Uncharacterized protein n=2 Tax=Aspergillus niger TaxID=5061 RepID=A2QF96_ASPNC|nr:hypothetical protein An02g13760 [Aspergillus niger]CAK37960.1 hypothetical protein An02g13760 [Aspergillus niger]
MGQSRTPLARELYCRGIQVSPWTGALRNATGLNNAKQGPMVFASGTGANDYLLKADMAEVKPLTNNFVGRHASSITLNLLHPEGEESKAKRPASAWTRTYSGWTSRITGARHPPVRGRGAGKRTAWLQCDGTRPLSIDHGAEDVEMRERDLEMDALTSPGIGWRQADRRGVLAGLLLTSYSTLSKIPSSRSQIISVLDLCHQGFDCESMQRSINNQQHDLVFLQNIETAQNQHPPNHGCNPTHQQCRVD